MQFRLRAAAALTAAAVIVLGAAVSQPAVAADDPASTVSDAVLEWGINPLQQIATPNGACNYFTAGVTNGKEESYAAQAGNVKIIKRLASGATLPAEKGTRCDATAGSEIGQRGVFSEGTGVFDRAAGTASLSWTGSLTVNSYGGLVPWHLTNPKLVVADGKARLSATIGGVASDMSNPTNSAPIPDAADQTILELSGVQLTDEGIMGTPVFDNVDYYPLNDPANASSGRHATSAVPDAAKTARWGAWPQDLVDFHYRTGLTSYWHSLAAGDAARKGPLGISIRFTADETTTPEVTPISITQQPTRTEAVPGDDVTFTVRATGAQSYQWQYRTGWDGIWADIAGETGTSITITNAQTTNTGHYRVVLSNADIPRVESRQAELTVKPAEPLTQMNGQKSLTVFEGGRMWLVTGFTGYPSPTFATQRSDDGGRTWVRLGTNDSMPFYEQAQADKSWDGSLFRVVASNRFEPAVAGKPIPVKVLPRPTVQTLIIDPNEHAADARFDQSVRNDISVMGAPFAKGKTVRFGVAPTDAWEAWVKNGTEIPESEYAWSAVVEESWNQFANGNFTRTARPDADTMKPGVSYSVVVIAIDGTHDMDAAARIPLKGVADPEPETGGPGTGGPGTGGPGTGGPGTGGPGTENPGTENPGTENPGTGNPGTEGPKPGTGQPHVTNPNSGTTEPGAGGHTQGSALASTGTEPSTPLMIGGGVLLLLGAALVTLRARRARS